MTASAFVRIESAPAFASLPCSLPGMKHPRPEPNDSPAKKNILIIGRKKAGRQLATYFKQHPASGFRVRGFLDDSERLGGDVLGRVADLADIARAHFVDEVILTAPYQKEIASRVIQEAQRHRLALKFVPDLLGIDPTSIVFDKVGDLPVLGLRQAPVPQLPFIFKRGADIFLSALLLVALAPLVAFIAFAIRLDSHGPVHYRAQRIGKKGRRFFCVKFRSMIPGADRLKEQLRAFNQRQGPTFKLTDDPRITRVGRFLRRYSLDELPQLWNVLRGEMSLVGPRPHPLDDFRHYSLDHLRRLDVTPGITGLWQVTARNDSSFNRNLELDLEYIEHWSFWLDLRILCKTVVAVLEGSGS